MLWALAGALLIGLSMGLMGSGGSILTVPVLTYLVGQDEKVAIASSLAIVGVISAFGGIPYARASQVDYRSVLLFGVPGMVGAYFGAHLSRFVDGSTQLLAFSGLMLVAAVLMFRPIKPRDSDAPRPRRSPAKICLDGLIVGVFTGFVGVGGGFLIVPALVLLGGLPMHRAVGTSLFIIALKSATGFIKYLEVLDELQLSLNYEVIAAFATLGIFGSLAGNQVGNRLDQATLRRIFACFLLAIGAFIFAKSSPELVHTASSGQESAIQGVAS